MSPMTRKGDDICCKFVLEKRMESILILVLGRKGDFSVMLM